jgi:H+/Cl- antiporter ClcA
MTLTSYLRSLCTPAYVYLCIGAISILATIIQNIGDQSRLCVGNFECEVEHVGFVLVAQGLYVAFWTFVLSSICKAGHRRVAWFLVLIPFILGAILLAMFMISRPGYKHREHVSHYVPQ